MATTATRAPTRGGPLRHRPDIDGLRAVAILLVVGYHANVPGFEGGFVGVDVFFVLSGFLITGLIVAETDATGSLRLDLFWARRARRLLPAAATTIGAVLLASQLIESPLRWKSTITEGLAALFYWSNHLFAGQADNYFAADLYATPLLHMWSLAVEEQFYIFWPLVLWLLSRFVSPGPGLGRARLVLVTGVVAGSLLISTRLTDQESPLAFYGALSRAWEFGAGALLALVLGTGGSVRTMAARRVLTVGGMGLLVLGLLTIDSGSSFPMWTALLPVIATVCVIAAEPERGLVGGALHSQPAQIIGRLSYSWYLWHWPVIVLGTVHLGTDTAPVRVGLSLLALAPAALTRVLVENPVRQSRRLIGSRRLTVGVVGSFTLVVVLIASAGWLRADHELRDPLLRALASAREDVVDVTGPCTSTEPSVVLSACLGGDPDGSRLVLVLGDSHGAHWMPAVDTAAAELGWRMTASVRASCPAIEVAFSDRTPACRQRQGEIRPLVEALRPDLVIMSHSAGYVGRLEDPSGSEGRSVRQAEIWQTSVEEFARFLDEDGIDLVVVLDVPRFDSNPLECVAEARDTAPCDLDAESVQEFLGPVHQAEIRALGEAGHGSWFDPLRLLCSNSTCPVFVDGQVAYGDSHHLTITMARLFGDELAEAMI